MPCMGIGVIPGMLMPAIGIGGMDIPGMPMGKP